MGPRGRVNDQRMTKMHRDVNRNSFSWVFGVYVAQGRGEDSASAPARREEEKHGEEEVERRASERKEDTRRCCG